jgi:hypothetical protein
MFSDMTLQLPKGSAAVMARSSAACAHHDRLD